MNKPIPFDPLWQSFQCPKCLSYGMKANCIFLDIQFQKCELLLTCTMCKAEYASMETADSVAPCAEPASL